MAAFGVSSAGGDIVGGRTQVQGMLPLAETDEVFPRAESLIS